MSDDDCCILFFVAWFIVVFFIISDPLKRFSELTVRFDTSGKTRGKFNFSVNFTSGNFVVLSAPVVHPLPPSRISIPLCLFYCVLALPASPIRWPSCLYWPVCLLPVPIARFSLRTVWVSGLCASVFNAWFCAVNLSLCCMSVMLVCVIFFFLLLFLVVDRDCLLMFLTFFYFSDPSGSNLFFCFCCCSIPSICSTDQVYLQWSRVSSSYNICQKISLAVSVTAVFKVVIIESMSESSLFMMARGANVPPIVAWKVSKTLESFIFSSSNLSHVCLGLLILSRRRW